MRHLRRSMSTVMAAVTVAAALAAVLAAQQQKPEDQQPPPPRFRTQANFVRVDVYPTADGRPIHDLKLEDFQILEDGTPQRIEAFEYVQVRAAGPQSARVEPGTVQAGEQLAANPRNRVFIVFLDVPHVRVESAHAINQPLIRLLDRVLGPDDLVAVMTPSMSVRELTLGRKTEVLARGLRDNWPWGEKNRLAPMDEWEQDIEVCFPPERGEGHRSALAQALVSLRRERITLEALEDLVRYLQTIREERKAVITISEGWMLFRADERLMQLRRDREIPGLPPIGVGPGGKLTTEEWNQPGRRSQYKCDADRLRLANVDNDQSFRDLLGRANRANVSFYPVDPRGLPASDSDITANVPPAVDHAILKRQIVSLETLAENTDGIAIVNSNDLDRGLRRVSGDLTSYYLLGYYSTSTRLDGGFRQIKVRVKRPGVAVRARPGYQAPTAEEIAAATAAAAAPAPRATAALDAALSALSRMRPEARLLVNASAVSGASVVWVAGEVTSSGAADLAPGATADVEVTANGQSGTARVTLGAGERAFLVPVAMHVPTGEVTVRVRLASGTVPATDTIRFTAAPGLAQPLLFRRSAATSNRWRPAADFRFSRTERVRVDVPIEAGAKPEGGRVLDKSGNPLELPVTVSERTDDATGQRWATAEVTLAPVGNGEYGIELASGGQKVVTAIRVGR